MVFIDKYGEVMSPSIYYTDVRGSVESRSVPSLIDTGRLMDITGLSPSPMFSASKLMWIKKNQPELIENAEAIFLYVDYVTWKLSGERAIDYSLASRTMLLDIYNKEWSDEVAGALGLSTEKFSPLFKAGTAMGKILPDIASELGLPPDTVIILGGHDQVFCAVGGGAVKPGDSVDIMGSGESLSLVINKDAASPLMGKYRYCVEPYFFDDCYLTLAFNASAGTAIKWYRDCYNADRSEEAKAGAMSLYELMDSECPESPTDIFFLPYLAGGGTPYIDVQAGGTFIGVRQGDTRAKIYKSLLEGLCYEITSNMEFLSECGLSISRIACAGGGAISDVLMQIKADVTNREINVLKNWETGTIGLALLCANAMGEIDDIAVAAVKLSEIEKIFRPDPERAAFYKSKMEVYKNIYPVIAKLLSIEYGF
jgi:xylulokinase